MASNTNKPASSYPTNDSKRGPEKLKKSDLSGVPVDNGKSTQETVEETLNDNTLHTFVDQLFSSLPQTEEYKGYRSIFIQEQISLDDKLNDKKLVEIGVGIAKEVHRDKILRAFDTKKAEAEAASQQAGESAADSNQADLDLETYFTWCVSYKFDSLKSRIKKLKMTEFDSMTTSNEILFKFREQWQKAEFRDTFFNGKDKIGVPPLGTKKKMDLFELHFYRYCWLIDNIDDLQANCWARCVSWRNKGNNYVPVSVGYARGIMIGAPFMIMALASILHISGVPSEVYYLLLIVALGVYFIHLLLVVYTYYTVHYRCCDHCSWEVDDANITDVETGVEELEAGGRGDSEDLEAKVPKDANTTKKMNQAKSRKRVPNYRGGSSSCIREILKDYALPFLRNQQFSWFHRAFIQLWPGIFAYCLVTTLFEGDYSASLKVLGMAVIIILGHIVAINGKNWRALVREYQWAVMFCCIKRPLVEYQQHVDFKNPNHSRSSKSQQLYEHCKYLIRELNLTERACNVAIPRSDGSIPREYKVLHEMMKENQEARIMDLEDALKDLSEIDSFRLGMLVEEFSFVEVTLKYLDIDVCSCCAC